MGLAIFKGLREQVNPKVISPSLPSPPLGWGLTCLLQGCPSVERPGSPR